MKMLKIKHFRRIVVFLAMIAPAVYLFGSLFSALTGAHGTEVFAEPVYVQEWVDVDDVGDTSQSYRYVLGVANADEIKTVQATSLGTVGYTICRNSFYLNEMAVDPTSFGFSMYSDDQGGDYRRLFVYVNGGETPFRLFNSDGTFSYSLPWNFSGDLVALYQIAAFFDFGQWQVLAGVPTSVVSENAGAYSDYVFKNFFAKDNFLVEIGKDVLSDNPHGFAPFASFWKYLDENMLHMGDMQLGLMGYGYVYYCCHVLLFDIAFILVTFFLDFIQKVNDKIVGGVD